MKALPLVRTGVLLSGLGPLAFAPTPSAVPPDMLIWGPAERLAQTQPAENHKQPRQVDAEVRRIISEHLGVPLQKITPHAQFVKDLGADSLDLCELTMAFEEQFDIEIPDADAEHIQTVGDAITYIEGRLSAPAPSR